MVEYYGLVAIIPGTVAKRVIKKLDGKQLNGQKIGVSAYFVRNSRNERRASYRVGTRFLDKRKADRRRPFLEKVYLEMDAGEGGLEQDLDKPRQKQVIAPSNQPKQGIVTRP